MSVLSRLLLLFVVAFLPLAAVQTVSAYNLQEQRRRELHDDALRLSRLTAEEVDRIADGTRRLLISLVELREMRQHDASACTDLLDRLVVQFPGYAAIGMADPEGRIFCASGSKRGQSVADRPWFRQAADRDGFVIGEYTINYQTGRPVLPFAMAARGPNGGLYGIVAVALDLGWLAQQLRSKPWPDNARVVVADRHGTLLVTLPHDDGIGRPAPAVLAPLLDAATAGVADRPGSDGRERIIGYQPVDTQPEGIAVAVSLDPEVGVSPLDTLFWWTVAWSAACFLLALGAVYWLGREWIRRPVWRLLAAIERWEQGDYSARAAFAGRAASEFAQLGAKFDALAERLVQRERELRRVSEARRRLLAIAGHDLRQPLTLFLGFLDRLGHRPGLPPDPVALGRAERAMSRLQRSLDAMSDIVRLDGGTVPRPRPFDAQDFLLDLQDEWRDEAAAKGLVLKVRTCPARVTSDPDLLRTVMTNLVANAIRYTERGGVLLACQRRRHGLLLRVVDTGIGIPEDRVGAMFGEFEQLRPDRKLGMGLGLWIVSRTLDVLGHPLIVRSRLGHGSSFSVEVPLAPATVDPAHAGDKPRPARHRRGAWHRIPRP